MPTPPSLRALGVAVVAAGCAPPPCNGDAALCARTLDRVTLPATHNAMSNAAEGWWGPNQGTPPARQLEAGIRGMLLDTYPGDDGRVWLCHGDCAFGATPLADVLGDLAAFLDGNPREVVVLVFEDGVSVDATLDAFEAAGLSDRLVAAPADGAGWPTLGALADAGTTLLATRQSDGPGPPTYAPFYELGFDTPYSFQDVEDFTCDVLRGDSSHDLFLVNHWLGPLPAEDLARVANAADVLGPRVRACSETYGRPPTLVAVDHAEIGDLLAVVAEANARPE